MKFLLMSCVAFAVASTVGLAGCANNQAPVMSVAPTAPMKVNVSTPTLAAGYVKVAATPGSALDDAECPARASVTSTRQARTISRAGR